MLRKNLACFLPLLAGDEGKGVSSEHYPHAVMQVVDLRWAKLIGTQAGTSHDSSLIQHALMRTHKKMTYMFDATMQVPGLCTVPMEASQRNMLRTMHVALSCVVLIF